MGLPSAIPWLAVCLLSPVLRTQDDGASQRFQSWLDRYIAGKEDFQGSRGGSDYKAIERMKRLFREVAMSDDLAAAKTLWHAAVVELSPELDKHKVLAAQQGLVREDAKLVIAAIADGGVDDWLMDMVFGGKGGRRSLKRMTALEILGMRSPEGFAERLLPKLNSLGNSERAQALLALEKAQTPEALPILARMLKERAIEVRIAGVQAFCGVLSHWSDQTREDGGESETAKVWVPKACELLGKLLAREKVWQVESATVDGLTRLKHRDVIPVLIKGFKSEKMRGKRANDFLLETYHLALAGLTGRDLPRSRPDLWGRFWEEEGKDFKYTQVDRRGKKIKPTRSGAAYASYFNLDLRSKRVLFVIDFSGSMREKVQLKGRYAGGRDQVKYELVKRELEKVVRSLPKDAITNVIFFNTEVSAWRMGKSGPALVKMNDANKSDLLNYVWQTNPGGATNLHGGLKLALGIGGRGVHDKYYKTAYDTLFILSDGAPSAGEITDPPTILQEVGRANKLRRIKIHSIVFGDSRNNLDFMRRLAQDNDGQFHHVQ